MEQVFTNAIDCLSDDDKKLPQVCMYVCTVMSLVCVMGLWLCHYTYICALVNNHRCLLVLLIRFSRGDKGGILHPLKSFVPLELGNLYLVNRHAQSVEVLPPLYILNLDLLLLNCFLEKSLIM